MNRIQELRNQLQLHNRQVSFSAQMSEAETEIHNCISERIQLQIECEGFREAYRKEFLMVKYKTSSKQENDLVITETKTFFKWEDLTQMTFDFINTKEAKGIAYYGDKIKKLRSQIIPDEVSTQQ